MSATQRPFRCAGAAVTGAGLVLVAGLSSVTANADDIIVLGGITTSTTTTAAQKAMAQLAEEDRSTLCDDVIDPLAVATSLNETFGNADAQIQDQMAQVDPALNDDYQARKEATFRTALDIARERLEAACANPETQTHLVNIIYSTCRMTMRDGTHMIDVRFPPDREEGFLTFLDPTTLQAIELPLKGMPGVKNIDFTQFLNQDTGYVQGMNTGTVTGPGAARDKEIAYDFTGALTLPGREYTFRFDFELNIARSLMGIAGAQGMGGQGLGAAEQAQLEQLMQMAPSPKVVSFGNALIVPEAPGLEIIREFYKTFAAAMGADGAYLTGLYNHRLLADGMPIELNQTTEVAMTGIMGIGAASTESSTSTMEITSIIGPLSTDYAYCEPSIVPDNYTTSSPLAGAGPTTAASGGGPDAAGGSAAPGGTSATPDEGSGSVYSLEICDDLDQATLADMDPEERAAIQPQCPNLAMAEAAQAMSAAQEAMRSMTPEQRAAMQQVGGLFGGLFGGAGPGGGATAQAPVPAPAAPARAGAGASSSDLMTDNLTQSTQNMLQALGYDPGNTDGEVSVETTIAISQFQAEKGLQVTGEVTPQLVGILAAEVDSR